MAFLEVVTRTFRRPTLLAINRESLEQQTDDDWSQSFIDDPIGRGVGYSYERLAMFPVRGDYIWILDDDDLCARPTLVAELKAIAAEHDPEVIMLKMDHGPRGILPDYPHWGAFPVVAHIGCSAYVVRRDVWCAFAHAFLPGSYQSDFQFISRVFLDSARRIYWHDVIASRVQRISLGAPE